ncbi:Uncharacterised protein [Amycolatopsis camponoti]|uniref:Uncharacterized protein n=1 Tax=Amycolatopsis camponoti TaxID=2606593 RepID=A0A6I8LT78_9PSEU|nr:Uncharacterised protein [Amycolatopsis camponoti]
MPLPGDVAAQHCHQVPTSTELPTGRSVICMVAAGRRDRKGRRLTPAGPLPLLSDTAR